MSDSPMWKRGKRSRSKSWTLWPCCAIRVEAVEPAGPPPMTTTSALSAGVRGGVKARPQLGSRGTASGPQSGRVLMRCAGGAEQVDQRSQLLPAQVAELLGVAGSHLGVELVQQGQTLLRDADMDHPAVIRTPLTLDQPV